MKITKCDVCKKKINGEPITAGIGFFPKAELCERCGAPIFQLLKRHRFIELKKSVKSSPKLYAH